MKKASDIKLASMSIYLLTCAHIYTPQTIPFSYSYYCAMLMGKARPTGKISLVFPQML